MGLNAMIYRHPLVNLTSVNNIICTSRSTVYLRYNILKILLFLNIIAYYRERTKIQNGTTKPTLLANWSVNGQRVKVEDIRNENST